MPKLLACAHPPCVYTTKNPDSMKTHLYQVHRAAAGMTAPPHKCHFCDARFVNSTQRHEHEVEEHPGLHPSKGKVPAPRPPVDPERLERERTKGGAVATDNTVVHIPEVFVGHGKPRYACPVKGCTEHYSSRQHVRRHMGREHEGWGHLDEDRVQGTGQPLPRPLPRSSEVLVSSVYGPAMPPLSRGSKRGRDAESDAESNDGAVCDLTGDDAVVLVKRASRGMGPVCPLCHETLPSTTAKHRHLVKVHNYRPTAPTKHRDKTGRKVFVCPCGCDRTFSTREGFMRHQAKLTDAKAYVCAGCDKAFAVPSDLRRHEEHTCKARPAGPDMSLPCPVAGCGHRSPTARALAAHLASTKHAQVEPTLPCPEHCGYLGRTKTDVKRHVATVHLKMRSFCCQEPGCGAAFKDARALKDHVEWAHMEGARLHRCPQCVGAFATQRALRSHVTTVHGQRTYRCPRAGCFKAYPTSTCLQRHISAVHDGSWLEACPVCNVAFSSPFLLARHVLTHGAGYRHGKSDGEARMFEALTEAGVPFLPELRLPGTQMRFDFWTQWTLPTGRTSTILVEVDGIFHYRVQFGGPVGRMTFLGQVLRDLEKTRFAAQVGMLLFRTNAVSADHALTIGQLHHFAILGSRGQLPRFADYVYPESFQTPLAESIRAAVASVPLTATAATGAGPVCVDRHHAAIFLASNLNTIDFSAEDLDVLPPESADAVLALFLREHHSWPPAGADPTDPVHRYVHEACVAVARHMPEFQPGFRVVPSPAALPDTPPGFAEPGLPEPGDAPRSATVARHMLDEVVKARVAASGLARVLHTGTIRCWLCDAAPFVGTKEGQAALMRHLNEIHDNVAPIMCTLCSGKFTHFPCLPGPLHEDGCRYRVPGPKITANSRCGVPGCGKTFPTRCALYRHFNETHGTKFGDVMLQSCSACGYATKKDSLPIFMSHPCPAK